MLPSVLHRNLKTALARRDADAVAELLARLAEVDPDSVETLGLTLEWALVSGRLQEAARQSTALVARFPQSARVRWLAGRLAYAQRDYLGALDAFRESEHLAPGPSVRLWVGRTLVQRGDFDDAERVLVALGPAATMDLAWLHERRGDVPRAIALVEAHLAAHPTDRFALAARTRLVASTMDADEVLGEVEALTDLGEEVPVAMVGEALRHLLEAGRTADGRAMVDRELGRASPADTIRWGWVAYRAEALDLACDLFLRGFEQACTNLKFLSACERAAKASGRVPELVQACEAHAPRVPNLWGRARRLRKLLG